MTNVPRGGRTQRSVTAGALLTIVGVLAADLVSKALVVDRVGPLERHRVLGPLTIVYRRNTGGAFSLGSSRSVFPWLVTVLVVALVWWFVRAVRRHDPRVHGLPLYGVSAMVAGALGNQVDRWFRAPYWNRGAVVDFLELRYWPGIFNLADAALVCGALVVGLSTVRQREQRADETGALPVNSAADERADVGPSDVPSERNP